MTIFSNDVDEVRIAGSILIFGLSIIGACIPIIVARTYGRLGGASGGSNSPDEAAGLSRAQRRALRKHAALEQHKRQQTLKFVQHLFLALGAGVIVATAFMHMLPEGTESVATGYEGLRGGAAHDHADHAEDSGAVIAITTADAHDHDHTVAFAVSDATAAEPTTADAHDHANETTVDDHDHDHDNETTAAADDHDHDHDHAAEEAAAADEGGHDHGFSFGYLFVLVGLYLTFVVESEMHRALEKYDHGHSRSHGDAEEAHSHEAHADAVVAVATPAEAKAERRYQEEVTEVKRAQAKARLMEIAVATHSVIIGIAFGTLTSANTADTLALALIFHQLCEGLAVGAIFEAAFRAPPKRRGSPAAQEGYAHHLWLALYVFIFSLCVPIGIIIGIAIVEGGKDADSNTSLFVRGAFECFAAGVLIYVGCVEFLGGLFGSHSHSHVAAIPEDCSDAEDEAEAEAAAGDSASETESPHKKLTCENNDDNAFINSDGAVAMAVVVKTADEPEADAGPCDHHHHVENHPQGHILDTDSLFGRIATYALVFIGAAPMVVLSNWA